MASIYTIIGICGSFASIVALAFYLKDKHSGKEEKHNREASKTLVVFFFKKHNK